MGRLATFAFVNAPNRRRQNRAGFRGLQRVLWVFLATGAAVHQWRSQLWRVDGASEIFGNLSLSMAVYFVDCDWRRLVLPLLERADFRFCIARVARGFVVDWLARRFVCRLADFSGHDCEFVCALQFVDRCRDDDVFSRVASVVRHHHDQRHFIFEYSISNDAVGQYVGFSGHNTRDGLYAVVFCRAPHSSKPARSLFGLTVTKIICGRDFRWHARLVSGNIKP